MYFTMDVTLEKYNAKRHYGTPPGIKELLTDITREVLREQPVHIYLFIANYLKALLDARDCCRVARKAVADIIAYGELLANITRKYGIDVAAANAAATKIQVAYKCYKARQDQLRKDRLSERKKKETVCYTL